MKTVKLKIKTKSQEYFILIGSNLISKFSNILNQNSIKFEQCLLLVDSKVPKKMIKRIIRSLKGKRISLIFLKSNEKNKNQKTINFILNTLLKKNFTRNDCLISIGGGITGDIGGFASSLFKRGIKFINIPTTLLSQVDSSIGGKTGINTNFGKNLIGSFYQPNLVISDTHFLKTLPKREIICGYGEVLKHSLIRSKKFYNYLNRNVFNILKLKSPFIEKAIFESCKIKKNVIEKDENEKNLRKVLNFGHTFAHSYEAALNFSTKLNHGEAVILGVITATRFSYINKLIGKNEYNSIFNHIIKSNLPNNIKNYLSLKSLKKIIYFMKKNKKNNSDKINLILLTRIGKPIIDNQYDVKKLNSFMKKELRN